jgi:hypothetical protein
MSKSIYGDDMPQWVKNGASCSVVSVSKLKVARVEGNFLILEKEGVEYVCRNQDDVYQSWHLTSTYLQNESPNPGWTLLQSVEAQISRFNSERCELNERLDWLDNKIGKLEQWIENNADKSS